MPEALSLNDFAAQLSQASEPSGQAQEAPETEAVEVAEVEVDTTEAPEQDGEQSPESTEQEEADSEDGQAQTAPDEEMVIKWTTASGETHEAPLKELKDGYLRQSDYTQKTQQLSQEREKVQAAVFEQYQMTQQLGAELGQLQVLQSQIAQYQSLPWQQLKAENPEQYSALATEFMVLREQGRELAQNFQHKKSQLDAAMQREAEQAVVAASEHLKKAIPGFGDKHLSSMNEHMLSKGLKTEDLPEVVKKLGKKFAPAVLEAIHEAAQWKALQAKKPEIENRAKAIPPKPVAKAAAPKQVSQLEAVAKAAQSNKPMSSKSFAEMLAQTRKR